MYESKAIATTAFPAVAAVATAVATVTTATTDSNNRPKLNQNFFLTLTRFIVLSLNKDGNKLKLKNKVYIL